MGSLPPQSHKTHPGESLRQQPAPILPNLADLTPLAFTIDASSTGVSRVLRNCQRGLWVGSKRDSRRQIERRTSQNPLYPLNPPVLVLLYLALVRGRPFKYPGRPWFWSPLGLVRLAARARFCCDRPIILSPTLLLQPTLPLRLCLLLSHPFHSDPNSRFSRRAPAPSEVHIY